MLDNYKMIPCVFYFLSAVVVAYFCVAQARLAESKAQTQELMTKTKELQSEGSRLAMQKQLAERMRERFSLTTKVILTPFAWSRNSLTAIIRGFSFCSLVSDLEMI